MSRGITTICFFAISSWVTLQWGNHAFFFNSQIKNFELSTKSQSELNLVKKQSNSIAKL